MALTPIIKGMADGAEAIQANFTAIGVTRKAQTQTVRTSNLATAR